jgi:hypothetical protein
MGSYLLGPLLLTLEGIYTQIQLERRSCATEWGGDTGEGEGWCGMMTGGAPGATADGAVGVKLVRKSGRRVVSL